MIPASIERHISTFNTQTVFFPLGAVLLALLVQPRHPKAQLIVLAALVEYAVAAFFDRLRERAR